MPKDHFRIMLESELHLGGAGTAVEAIGVLNRLDRWGGSAVTTCASARVPSSEVWRQREVLGTTATWLTTECAATAGRRMAARPAHPSFAFPRFGHGAGGRVQSRQLVRPFAGSTEASARLPYRAPPGPGGRGHRRPARRGAGRLARPKAEGGQQSG